MSYGYDLSCTDSINLSRFASGVMLVGEALYRRLTTPRGKLFGSPEAEVYGLDLTGVIGTVDLPTLLASLPERIRSECLKDPRVSDAQVAIAPVDDALSVELFIEIAVTLQDENETFKLQILAGSVTAQLLGIR